MMNSEVYVHHRGAEHLIEGVRESDASNHDALVQNCVNLPRACPGGCTTDQLQKNSGGATGNPQFNSDRGIDVACDCPSGAMSS